MEKILVVLSDLFFAAKIRTVAAKLNKELVIVRTKEDLLSELSFGDVDKMIIDLNFSKFDIFTLFNEIDTKDIYTIGYCLEVNVNIMRKAENFFDLVLTREDFSKRLPELLS